MQFFKKIPEELFSLLSSPNKEIYLGSLISLFDEYEKGRIIGIERSLAVESIQDFLEINSFLIFDDKDISEDIDELFEEESKKETSFRDKANLILRKMLKCGWIQYDILPDFSEYIIFPDYAITLITAIKSIIKEEEANENIDPLVYRGYIYTIYSLLTQDEIRDYGMTMESVYNNTILFYRELRKIDFKLRSYIDQIVKKSEIKELMISLISHKEEIIDRLYLKLKTNENFNKYRFNIIKKLKEFQETPAILTQIAEFYMNEYKFDFDRSYHESERKINEVIDVFNSFENIIKEIDEKNKTYINSTISKIKFLLNNDTNVIGQLTTILKYAKEGILKGKTTQVLSNISPLFKFFDHKFLSADSLFTPRGTYRISQEPDILVNVDFDTAEFSEQLLAEYKSDYTEEIVMERLNQMMQGTDSLRISSLYKDRIEHNDIIFLLYVIIYSNSDTEYMVDILDDKVTIGNYRFNDFYIYRRSN